MICRKCATFSCRRQCPGRGTAFVRRRTRNRQTRLQAGFLGIAVFAAVLAVCTLHAQAFDTVVVKSADLKPYRDVIQGVKKACGCAIREVKIRDASDARSITASTADAVVAVGTSAFETVKQSRGIPVVYAMVMPSATDSPLRPNIMGVSMDISPNAYFAAMLDIVPALKRIGLLYDPRHTTAFVTDAIQSARAAGLNLIVEQVRDPREVPRLLDSMNGKIDVYWMLPDPTVVTAETVDYLLRFSFQHSVPVFSFSKKYVAMGAVAALEVDPYDMGVQAGELVKELSAGRTSAKHVYARAWHLSLNKNVAGKMGLKLRERIMTKGGTLE